MTPLRPHDQALDVPQRGQSRLGAVLLATLSVGALLAGLRANSTDPRLRSMPVKIDYSEEAMEGGDLRADSTGDWEKLKTTDQLSQMAGRYVLTTLNCAKFRCNHTNFFQTYTVTEASKQEVAGTAVKVKVRVDQLLVDAVMLDRADGAQELMSDCPIKVDPTMPDSKEGILSFNGEFSDDELRHLVVDGKDFQTTRDDKICKLESPDLQKTLVNTDSDLQRFATLTGQSFVTLHAKHKQEITYGSTHEEAAKFKGFVLTAADEAEIDAIYSKVAVPMKGAGPSEQCKTWYPELAHKSLNQLLKEIPESHDSRTVHSYCNMKFSFNQGECGSCWAQAASASYNWRLCVMSKGKYNSLMSTQTITSCTYPGPNFGNGRTTGGCEGGQVYQAYQGIVKHDFDVGTMDDDMYTGTDAISSRTPGNDDMYVWDRSGTNSAERCTPNLVTADNKRECVEEKARVHCKQHDPKCLSGWRRCSRAPTLSGEAKAAKQASTAHKGRSMRFIGDALQKCFVGWKFSDLLKYEVSHFGAVPTTVAAASGFSRSDGKVVARCDRKYGKLDHAVITIGYGIAPGTPWKTGFTEEGKQYWYRLNPGGPSEDNLFTFLWSKPDGPAPMEKYWLVQNSWGDSWKEDGFTRIYRDDDKSEYDCGIGGLSAQRSNAVLDPDYELMPKPPLVCDNGGDVHKINATVGCMDQLAYCAQVKSNGMCDQFKTTCCATCGGFDANKGPAPNYICTCRPPWTGAGKERQLIANHTDTNVGGGAGGSGSSSGAGAAGGMPTKRMLQVSDEKLDVDAKRKTMESRWKYTDSAPGCTTCGLKLRQNDPDGVCENGGVADEDACSCACKFGFGGGFCEDSVVDKQIGNFRAAFTEHDVKVRISDPTFQPQVGDYIGWNTINGNANEWAVLTRVCGTKDEWKEGVEPVQCLKMVKDGVFTFIAKGKVWTSGVDRLFFRYVQYNGVNKFGQDKGFSSKLGGPQFFSVWENPLASACTNVTVSVVDNTNGEMSQWSIMKPRTEAVVEAVAKEPTKVGFSRIKFNIDPKNDHTGLRNWGSANSVQVAELTLYTGGTTKLTNYAISNPGGNTPANEGARKLIDGNTGTKWLDFNKKSVVITFPQPVDVTSYSWVTANDSPERDPVKWSLEGSNDGNTWTALDRTHATDAYATSSTRGVLQGPFQTAKRTSDKRRLSEDQVVVAQSSGVDGDHWETVHTCIKRGAATFKAIDGLGRSWGGASVSVTADNSNAVLFYGAPNFFQTQSTDETYKWSAATGMLGWTSNRKDARVTFKNHEGGLETDVTKLGKIVTKSPEFLTPYKISFALDLMGTGKNAAHPADPEDPDYVGLVMVNAKTNKVEKQYEVPSTYKNIIVRGKAAEGKHAVTSVECPLTHRYGLTCACEGDCDGAWFGRPSLGGLSADGDRNNRRINGHFCNAQASGGEESATPVLTCTNKPFTEMETIGSAGLGGGHGATYTDPNGVTRKMNGGGCGMKLTRHCVGENIAKCSAGYRLLSCNCLSFAGACNTAEKLLTNDQSCFYRHEKKEVRAFARCGRDRFKIWEFGRTPNKETYRLELRDGERRGGNTTLSMHEVEVVSKLADKGMKFSAEFVVPMEQHLMLADTCTAKPIPAPKPSDATVVAATMSSGAGASSCADGVSSGGRMCESDSEKYPWLQLDLGTTKKVHSVTIFQRGGDCRSRLVRGGACRRYGQYCGTWARGQCGFEVRIGDVECKGKADDCRGTSTLCKSMPSGNNMYLPKTSNILVSCDQPIAGRYVHLILRGSDRVLNIVEMTAQVETQATVPGVNLMACDFDKGSCDWKKSGTYGDLSRTSSLTRRIKLKGLAVSMSSTASGHPGGLAIDGDASTNGAKCASTNKAKTNWWEVDLGEVRDINAVEVTNRGDWDGWKHWYEKDNMKKITVYVDGKECSGGPHTVETNGGSKKIPCNARGQKVRVHSTSRYSWKPIPFSICEVNIFETPIGPNSAKGEFLHLDNEPWSTKFGATKTNRHALFTSPMLHPTTVPPVFSFDYFMYGAAEDIGRLSVQGKVGTRWETLWARTGSQQKQGSDLWLTASFQLPEKVYYLQFNMSTPDSCDSSATKCTANRMSIDNIDLSLPSKSKCQREGVCAKREAGDKHCECKSGYQPPYCLYTRSPTATPTAVPTTAAPTSPTSAPTPNPTEAPTLPTASPTQAPTKLVCRDYETSSSTTYLRRTIPIARQAVQFSVKAKGEAHLAFFEQTKGSTPSEAKSYEIVLGTSANTKSLIRGPSGYTGCYANEGANRVNGHTRDRSYAACEALAQAQGKTFFALEYPQGYTTAGNAECLPLGAVPSMQKVADSECEAEGMFNGKRLGSGNRLAVYRGAETVLQKKGLLTDSKYSDFWASAKDGVVKLGAGKIEGKNELMSYKVPAADRLGNLATIGLKTGFGQGSGPAKWKVCTADNLPEAPTCKDTAKWSSGNWAGSCWKLGKYYCKHNKLKYTWMGSKSYNNPQENCCKCGKPY